MISNLIQCKACSNEIASSADSCPKCGNKNDWVHPRIMAFVDKVKYLKDIPECQWRYKRTWVEVTAKKPRSLDLASVFIKFVGWLVLLVLWETLAAPLRLDPVGILVMSVGELLLGLGSGYYLIYGVGAFLKEAFGSVEDSVNTWKTHDMIRVDFSEDLNHPKVTCNNDEAWKDVIQFFEQKEAA